MAIAYLAERRIDARPLLVRLGLAEAPRTEPVFLPLAKVRVFLDGCAKLANDPRFGWNLALHPALGMYGLVEFVMRTAETLGVGIDSVCRYGALINGLSTFDAVERGTELGFGVGIAGEREAGGVQLNEYILHYMLRLVRLFGATPTQLELAHRAREGDGALPGVEVPVYYGRPQCRIWIPRDELARSSPLSDPVLHRFLAEQLASAFAADARDDVVRGVHDVLAARLGRGSLDVGDIARVLGTSPRTLQRRLHQAGTSYRDVVDLVRHQRANELLLVESLSIGEIAERVGYDDPAVFARAFKRWTGQSPRQLRRTE